MVMFYSTNCTKDEEVKAYEYWEFTVKVDTWEELENPSYSYLYNDAALPSWLNSTNSIAEEQMLWGYPPKEERGYNLITVTVETEDYNFYCSFFLNVLNNFPYANWTTLWEIEVYAVTHDTYTLPEEAIVDIDDELTYTAWYLLEMS